MPDLVIKHGTYAAYVSRTTPCRCNRCRAAKRDYQASRRRALKGTLPADDRRHGTRNAYDHYGCRCRPCVQAHETARNAYHRQRSAR